MIRGPAGGPRPLAKHQIVFDPTAMSIYIVNTGPLGGPRPLAKINPEVQDDRVKECIISESGKAFGVGSVTNGNVTDIEELDPEARLDALRRAEKWCRGVLDKSSTPGLSSDEVEERFNELVEQYTEEAGGDVDTVPSVYDGEEA